MKIEINGCSGELVEEKNVILTLADFVSNAERFAKAKSDLDAHILALTDEMNKHDITKSELTWFRESFDKATAELALVPSPAKGSFAAEIQSGAARALAQLKKDAPAVNQARAKVGIAKVPELGAAKNGCSICGLEGARARGKFATKHTKAQHRKTQA